MPKQRKRQRGEKTNEKKRLGKTFLNRIRSTCGSVSVWLLRIGKGCATVAKRLFRILQTLWCAFLLRFFKKVVLPCTAVLLTLCVLLGSFALIISAAVRDKTEDRILTVEEAEALEGELDCILVLGCRVYANGEPSPMLYDRVATGCALYGKGVCDKLLMSGDNRDIYYNEIEAMCREAMALGVPEEAILTDRYGLSTYDSVVRLLEEYEGRRVIIVTQTYHLYRALYLAEKLGVEAYGVGADLRPYYGQTKRDLREVLARCKDVVYAHKRPPTAYERDAEDR